MSDEYTIKVPYGSKVKVINGCGEVVWPVEEKRYVGQIYCGKKWNDWAESDSKEELEACFVIPTDQRIFDRQEQRVVWPKPDLWWEYLRGNGQWALSSHSNKMTADEMEEHLKRYKETNDVHCAYRLIDHATGEVVHEIAAWRKPEEPKYRLEYWNPYFDTNWEGMVNRRCVDEAYHAAKGSQADKNGRIVRQSDGKVVKEWRTRPLREWLEEGTVPDGYATKSHEWADGGEVVGVSLVDVTPYRPCAVLHDGRVVICIDRDVTVVTVEEEEE